MDSRMRRRQADRLCQLLVLRGRLRCVPLALAGCWAASGAFAADGVSATVPRQLAVEPSLSVSQVFTDNYALSSDSPRSDAITRVSAGIGLRSNAGVVRGIVDYGLTGLLYARHSDKNAMQNALRANVVADLLEDRLQMVASASIARSAISAFGVQPGSGTDANANTTEVRTLQLTPTLRGVLGPAVRYTATLGYGLSNAASGSAGDSSNTSATLRLEPASSARLRWNLDATFQETDFKQGRSTRSDRVSGGLLLDVNELDLQLSSTVGRERTDLASIDSRIYTTWGVGAVWAPSPITRVSAEMENRFFGRSYAVTVEHRTPRTVFSYRNGRSLSTGGSQGAGLRATVFDLFFAQLASEQPDPALRADLVNRRLRDQGIDPGQQVNPGFLQSAATVQDQHLLSAAWTGPRNTAVVSWTSTASRRADGSTSALDDLSGNAEVRQHGLSLAMSHRLTPQSSLVAQLSSQRASGSQQQSTRQRQAEVQYSSRLTVDSTVALSLRRALFTGSPQSYDENAITATYGQRF